MDTGDGPWVLRALAALVDCRPVTVVVGAQADEVAALLPSHVGVVCNEQFELGMGSSLRRGLRSLAAGPDEDDVDAVVVMLVDLPDVGAAVVRRIVAAADGPGAVDGPRPSPAAGRGSPGASGSGPGPGARTDARSALVRAAYSGRPGHPVLLGRDHWPGVLATATGDQGARGYLAEHPVTAVECGDLATGLDIDRPVGPLPEARLAELARPLSNIGAGTGR